MSLLTSSPTNLARTVMERIEALGRISEEEGKLTRTFCSSAMRRANDIVATWMREAGMHVREDAIGNVIGRYPKVQSRKSKVQSRTQKNTLLLGSHLDTVRDAGKFDGALGLLVAIACVQHLQESGTKLPFAIEVIGFADEEGVRYQSTYLGSKVLAGTFNPEDLKRTDEHGVTMADAIRRFGGNPAALEDAKLDRKRLLGYIEVHIEQGPVLEEQNLSVGVVTGIAGQSRFLYRFFGDAGHAGTVPMDMRADALCAAAEFVLGVETYARKRPGLVATVGHIQALPGATNVIPGEVNLTLDIRHMDDAERLKACAKLYDLAKDLDRPVKAEGSRIHEARSIHCDQPLTKLLAKTVKRHQRECVMLPSGAGHDAAAMAAITPVAMLFVRCRKGISHHPSESVKLEDVRAAIAVMNDFLIELAEQKAS